MAEPLIINASTVPIGMSMESPPVLGSCWPSGIVSRITLSLGEVLSPVVADPVVFAPVVSPVLAPVVSPLVVPVVVPVVSVVPVVVPVVVRHNLTRRSFKPLLKRAGLPQIRFHDLRRTCATLLLTRNVNPKIVSEMLGHSSKAITLDTYSHVLPNMRDQAAAAMEETLS